MYFQNRLLFRTILGMSTVWFLLWVNEHMVLKKNYYLREFSFEIMVIYISGTVYVVIKKCHYFFPFLEISI